jgi:hypothetical protein
VKKGYHILMIGRPGEVPLALSAGWDRRNIIKPPFYTFEGRRYKTLLITWDGLAAMGDSSWMRERLHSDQVVMGTEIRIGDITPPPAEE